MAKLTKRFNNSSLPIALKWSFMIACFITLVMGLLGWFLISQQKEFHQQQNQVLGRTLVDQLARAASEPMLAQDKLALSVLVQQEGKDQLIIGMQVFDKGGLLLATTGASAIWDIRSLMEGKALPAQLIWQTPNIRAITFYSLIKYQGMTTGVALVSFDRKPLEEQQAHVTNVLLSITFGLVFFSILLAFPLAYRLYAPVRELVNAGNALKRDDPKALVRTERKDEIGRVLDTFHLLADGMEEKRKVESAFSQFLSPSIAKQVLQQPHGTQLGGKTIDGSVLFCDVVGFTEMSETLLPVEVGQLLNQYFSYFSVATHSCHGTVDKFIGDCMMILFGVPEQDDQHGIHAVTCAVLIQQLAARINFQRQLKGLPIVQFRIGINSGEMLAGNLGSAERMQYTVVGDVVNLTSRICSLCEPGQILVTSETMEQQGLKAITEHKPLGAVQVKGRKRPVYPYVIDMEHFIRKSDIDSFMAQVLPDGELL
ncbi:MAG: hypothetical protein DRQ47_03125 [Gammaproteobacteria bacterium]|nr:MAG: hypothetical protein DRQ47_03125 [Gammaproteobacteria bacterium]